MKKRITACGPGKIVDRETVQDFSDGRGHCPQDILRAPNSFFTPSRPRRARADGERA